MRRYPFIAVVMAAALVVAAQPAMANWQQQNSPLPSGSSGGTLTGAACPVPGTCFAVGSYQDASHVTHALALRSSTMSTVWNVETVPEPSGATSSEFNGLSCLSSTACWGVGDYNTGSTQAPMTEYWDGSVWAVYTPVDPAGAASAVLDSVSCTNPSACTAVGSWSDGTNNHVLVEVRANGTWTVQSAPEPAGSTGSNFSGVSCPAANSCMAVGESSDTTGQHSLAETYNGTSWSIQSAVPSGIGLGGVSCPAVNECTVVGFHQAAAWNGTAWTTENVPSPSPHSGLASLLGVSCQSAMSCYAAGSYYVDGVQQGVTEYFNGAHWVVQDSPISSSSDTSSLAAVGCSNDHLCVAVGTYQDSTTNAYEPWIEDFRLRWQPQAVIVPSGSIASGMSDVSCTSTMFCMGVDTFEGSGSTFGTSSQEWNGGSWQDITTPNSANSDLNGISCTSRKACTAVGDVASGTGTYLPLAERWNGTTWTVQMPPAVARANDSYLLSVSCTSATFCMAVGEYRTLSGDQFTMAESWNGTTWTLQPSVDPSGTTNDQLTHVACPSTTSCYAVGWTGPGGAGLLAEHWNGSTWTVQVTPLPSGGKSGVFLGAACVTDSFCQAVGDYNSGTAVVPLAEEWNGTSWSSQPVELPPTTFTSDLSGVSCSSVTTCVAVGGGDNHHSGLKAISERWGGSSWAWHNANVAATDSPSGLAAIACPTDLFCEGVGYYSPTGGGNTGNNLDLADQYS